MAFAKRLLAVALRIPSYLLPRFCASWQIAAAKALCTIITLPNNIKCVGVYHVLASVRREWMAISNS